MTAHGGKSSDIAVVQLENSTKNHQGEKNQPSCFHSLRGNWLILYFKEGSSSCHSSSCFQQMCGIAYWPAAHLWDQLVLWEVPTLLERARNSILTGYYKFTQFLLLMYLVLFRMCGETPFYYFSQEKNGLLSSVWREGMKERKECSPTAAEATVGRWDVCRWVPAPTFTLTCLRAMTFLWKWARQELGIARQRNAFVRVRSARSQTVLCKPGWQCSLPMADAESKVRVHRKILQLSHCRCWHIQLARQSFTC